MSLLPTSERTKERLAEILEERGLSFLFPLLRIQAELSKQLQADPNPNQFYKWIKENLDVSYHADPGFINALVTVLIKYITQVRFFILKKTFNNYFYYCVYIIVFRDFYFMSSISIFSTILGIGCGTSCCRCYFTRQH